MGPASKPHCRCRRERVRTRTCIPFRPPVSPRLGLLRKSTCISLIYASLLSASWALAATRNPRASGARRSFIFTSHSAPNSNTVYVTNLTKGSREKYKTSCRRTIYHAGQSSAILSGATGKPWTRFKTPAACHCLSRSLSYCLNVWAAAAQWVLLQ